MATAQNLELCLVRNLKEWLKHPQVIKHKAGALFPSNRRPFVSVSKTTYKENLKVALKGSGLPKISPHGFHARFISATLERGVQPNRVQVVGRWGQECSMRPYIKSSKATRLQVAAQCSL